MKHLKTICGAIFSLMMMAQISAQADTTIVTENNTDTYADTVRRVYIDVDRGGENKYVNVVRRKTVRTRLSLVEVGLNTFVNTSGYEVEGINPFDLDILKSTSISYFPYMQRISLIKRNLNLFHGLSIDYQEFNFQNSVTLNSNEPSAFFTLNDDVRYKKNKLKVMYLSIPVMLNLETNPFKYSRSFRLSAGIQGGIRIRSWTKNKSDEFGKVKDKDDFNLNRFRLAFRGELGVGIFNIFGILNITEFFEPEQNGGFEVYPLTVGIKVLPF